VQQVEHVVGHRDAALRVLVGVAAAALLQAAEVRTSIRAKCDDLAVEDDRPVAHHLAQDRQFGELVQQGQVVAGEQPQPTGFDIGDGSVAIELGHPAWARRDIPGDS
jgi:hypothetical protein